MGFLQEKKPEFGSAEEISNNVLASLRPPSAAQAAQPSAPVQGTPGRRRLSILDALGGVVDTLAEFGGSNAGYREGMERRQEQETRALEQDWKQKFNQQKLDAGENELDTARFERFGTAAKGLDFVMRRSGIAGVQKAFPMLAQQMGMDPDEQEVFAASLESDPQGTIEIFRAINTAPENAGSKPKEIAVYEMLNKQNPELASQYLERVASGMSEYQEGQLGLGQDKLRSAEKIARIRAASAGRGGASAGKPSKMQEAAAARVGAAQAAKSVLSDMRDAYGRLKQAGGINARGQNVTQRAAAAAQENIPMIERMANPEGFSARQDLERLRTTGISSLLPLLGSLNLGSRNIDAAKELETWRKAIASASDYESAMRALDGIEKRIGEITAEAPASSGGSPSRPRIKLRPKNTAAPGKRMKYNPATGRIE